MRTTKRVPDKVKKILVKDMFNYINSFNSKLYTKKQNLFSLEMTMRFSEIIHKKDWECRDISFLEDFYSRSLSSLVNFIPGDQRKEIVEAQMILSFLKKAG